MGKYPLYSGINVSDRITFYSLWLTYIQISKIAALEIVRGEDSWLGFSLSSICLGHLWLRNCYTSFLVYNTTPKSHKIIKEFVRTFLYKKVFLSIFQYSQVVKGTVSYKRLPWQHSLTDINFKYICGEGIKIPIHIYQIHNSVIDV